MPPGEQPTDSGDRFPRYCFAAQDLVAVRDRAATKGSKTVARVIRGEWMKSLEENGALPATGPFRVRYRGGKGYVDASDVSQQRQLEIFFIDVDQGDAALIQTPDDRRILVDGGASDEAHRFIRDKYRLDKDENFIDLDAVVATHCDEDHTGGLIPVLRDPKIAVKRFFHNGLFRRTTPKVDPGPRRAGRLTGLIDRPRASTTPKLKPLMLDLAAAIDQAETNLPVVLARMAAQARWADRDAAFEFVCRRLDASDRHMHPFDGPRRDVSIEVLWPVAAEGSDGPSLPWYGDAGKTVNGNSIVLKVWHGKNRILLTGDLNEEAMDDVVAIAGSRAGALRSDVYKAAHHGSQHFTIPFIRKIAPQAVVISSGDDRQDQYGHPRAILLGTVTRYSRTTPWPAVFCTELAACYSKLSSADLKKFRNYEGQLYERSIRGIVHLRSDGDHLLLATVHGRRPVAGESQLANTTWKWDLWTKRLGAGQ